MEKNITFKKAWDELLRIVGTLEDCSQVCSVRPDDSTFCPAVGAREDLSKLREKIRAALQVMEQEYDLEGHRIIPWPETDRLREVAAKIGGNCSSEDLRQRCEALAQKMDITPGDALDFVDAKWSASNST